MVKLYYNQTQFLTSAASPSQFVKDTGMEVAFVGRSNAGKSSAINTITNINGLARTSKTPGRTQLINFFQIDSQRRIVDLPGYGFAKVPIKMKNNWHALIGEYLQSRHSLCGIVLMMDIRHPLTDFDWQMIKWSIDENLPVHILLTKCDKLSRGAANNTLLKVRKELSSYSDFVTAQCFSALKKLGIEEAHVKLDFWLNDDSDDDDYDDDN